MLKRIVKVGLILMITIGSLNAYDTEKEGKWWYIYNGNYLVGAYSNWADGYSIACGDPKLPVVKSDYVSGHYQFRTFKTKREAKNGILKHCKKR